MKHALLPLAAALALAGAATAEPVTVKVVGRPDGRPVAGVIKVRSNGAAVAGDFRTDASGVRTLPGIDCTLDVEVWVRPQNSDYSSDGKWRPCSANPIEYPLRPRQTAAQVRALAGLPAFLQADQQALLAAMDTDDAKVADLSLVMAAKLRAAGRPQDALVYTGLHAETQAETLRAAGFTMPDQIVKWDPDQKAFVSTPETVDALKLFQEENDLRVTGQWDLRTATTINQLNKSQFSVRGLGSGG